MVTGKLMCVGPSDSCLPLGAMMRLQDVFNISASTSSTLQKKQQVTVMMLQQLIERELAGQQHQLHDSRLWQAIAGVQFFTTACYTAHCIPKGVYASTLVQALPARCHRVMSSDQYWQYSDPGHTHAVVT